ncbi:hypothetical protein VDQ57_011165 [Xanthomonas campestris pv. campestris]|nr:hypothetical protein VDP59_011325 [Xanthomonas campestris pv. campestris]WVL63117.1 hypothetical protein VDQ57_011165 [Xanthomonas campestris pv. campestris]
MLGEQPFSSQAADQLIGALVEAVDVIRRHRADGQGELTLVLHEMALLAHTKAISTV